MIKGTGWVKQHQCGCLKHKWQKRYTDLKSLYTQLQPQVIKYPVANFARFDPVSKLTLLSIALALFDAKIDYAAGKKQKISILGSNQNAALAANLEYFNDYIANGRTLARGNLFIYTLPSSPLAEAAIHFGLTGSLFYLGFTKDAEKESLKYACQMLKAKSAKTILLVNADTQQATCWLLQR